MHQDQNQITGLLNRLNDEDSGAAEALVPLLYQELHRMARGRMRRERPGHTLGATALVHEAYLKLVNQKEARWQNRAHFFAIAARAMRRILINHARKRLAGKRGGGEPLATLDESFAAAPVRAEELIDLDQALNRLAELSERQARVVEYHFFVGLTHEEIAEVLEVSIPTVRRDWRLARAWLHRELGRSGP